MLASFTHASSVIAPVMLSDAALGARAMPVLPSKVTAWSVPAEITPGCPRVNPPIKVAALPLPDESAATAPLGSSNR